MEASEYESVLCVKPEVHVYRIPPRATNRGYRASEWQLDQPSWSGRLRITAKGQVAYIKLEDRTSGELFAQAPVDQFPGTAVESVTDSSRYFVIRIEDGNGRRAFIGIGFVDRGDAFDFNVALQDHFKWVKQQCEFAKQAQNPDQGPKLDLGFKEGQTIKLNIANIKKKEGTGSPRARPASTGGLSLLPPPPGGKTSTLIPPPGEQLSTGRSPVQPAFAPGTGGATESWPQPKPATAATADIWGDFTKSTGSASSQTQSGTGWVQF
ncbi:adaptin ear-binding coat-associated protein 2 isoform X1 [Ictidomys tridecemlineatus]|uniref:NECAP endocytosis associated 2 n=1 Tax=Ictidomys tridecemlineatus TaxID=43179 RepID=I3MLI8_ICTTR|nr:adaptin ear-binding coat-associated protein 2 isoform X2 [Ictidomys tridecemlineatus]KAG3282246.1 NECAP endocytosis associated 2, transcript variant X1 [Ictidomys tridecemlineatus]